MWNNLKCKNVSKSVGNISFVFAIHCNRLVSSPSAVKYSIGRQKSLVTFRTLYGAHIPQSKAAQVQNGWMKRYSSK